MTIQNNYNKVKRNKRKEEKRKEEGKKEEEGKGDRGDTLLVVLGQVEILLFACC